MMPPMGFPGDSDPRDEEFHPECSECGDLLTKDLWGDWFCPSCANEQAEKEEKCG